MKHQRNLLVAIIAVCIVGVVLAFGQSVSGPTSIGFLEGSLQGCLTPTAGQDFLCSVVGAGLQQSTNGAQYASLQGPPGPPGPAGPNYMALISGGSNSSLGAGATWYYAVNSPKPVNSSFIINEAMLPFAGTVDQLCVRTVSTQSGGSLTLTLYDTTAKTATPLTVTVAAANGPKVYCDMTDVATIVAQDSYAIQAVNTWTNASATVTGISARYSY